MTVPQLMIPEELGKLTFNELVSQADELIWRGDKLQIACRVENVGLIKIAVIPQGVEKAEIKGMGRKELVSLIKRLYHEQKWTQEQIAHRLNRSQSGISHILRQAEKDDE